MPGSSMFAAFLSFIFSKAHRKEEEEENGTATTKKLQQLNVQLLNNHIIQRRNKTGKDNTNADRRKKSGD